METPKLIQARPLQEKQYFLRSEFNLLGMLDLLEERILHPSNISYSKNIYSNSITLTGGFHVSQIKQSKLNNYVDI
jgi:hypothetical protein